MTSAADVAVAFRERIPDLPVKKLHKLLYYAQGHHLATFGLPLFDESVSAWDMGPVVGRLWYVEKDAGVAPLTSTIDEAGLNTIGYVVSRYGRLTGRDLEHLTHAESPWRRADAGRSPGGSARIEREWMRDYFRTEPIESVESVDVSMPASDSPVSPAEAAWLAGAAARGEDELQVDDPAELRRRLLDAS